MTGALAFVHERLDPYYSDRSTIRTIRPFLRTGCIGSGKAMSFATYLRGENHPMPAA
jgi:hypothetical protein